jgi:hypothetical protein
MRGDPVTNSSERLLKKAHRARLLAAGAANAHVRQEFIRLAEKLEAAAIADETS